MSYIDYGLDILVTLIMASGAYLIIDKVHHLFHDLMGTGLLVNNVGSVALILVGMLIFAAIGVLHGDSFDPLEYFVPALVIGLVHSLHTFVQPEFVGMGEAVAYTAGILVVVYRSAPALLNR